MHNPEPMISSDVVAQHIAADQLPAETPSWKTTVTKLLRLVGIPLALLITLLTWAVSTAPYGEPDAPYHLTSIYCARGNWDGVCEPAASPDKRLVRTDAATNVCYMGDAEKSAACVTNNYGRTNQQITEKGNFQGAYPELFYKTARLVVGKNTELNFLAVRTLNSVLITALTAAVIALAAPQRRSPLWLALAVTMVPVGISIIASINPSAWAIFTPALVFVAAASSFERTGWRRWTLYALTGIAMVMAAGARADAGIYALLGLVAALFLKVKLSRKVLLPVSIGAVLIAGITAVFAIKGRSGYFTWDTLLDLIASPLHGGSNLLGNLQNIPYIWSGIFGSWGLGWFDVPLPHAVPFFGLFTFAGVMFVAMQKMSARSTIVVGTMAALLVALPLFILHQRQEAVGSFVQPRYLLPLFVLLAVVIIWNWGERTLNGPQKFVIGTFLVASNALSLYSVIVRYHAGYAGNSGLWWSSYAPAMAVTLLIGVLSFTVFVVGILTWPPLRANTQKAASAELIPADDAEMTSLAAQ